MRITETNRQLAVRYSEPIEQIADKVIEQLKGASDYRDGQSLADAALVPLPTGGISDADQDDHITHDASRAEFSNLATTLKKLEALARSSRSNSRVLASLSFNQHESRQRHVNKAHARTFDWIFNDSSGSTDDCTFSTWLKIGDGFYWIQGKPGSGKSTLMKFLCQDRRTSQTLQVWADGAKMVTASFFFWRSGTKMQRSQDGLLRSLLFEILRNCPELIHKVSAACPAVLEFGWDVETMLTAFVVVAQEARDTKFCFFIDGLDEYEDDRRSVSDLVDTLRALASSPSVKLCVSSRPWMVFEDAFGEDPTRYLKLQDLTSGDINRYVTDKLHGHTQFAKLEKGNSDMSALSDAVVSKAQGVFLWVYLVVRDLLEGLTYHDTLKTLFKRLESFPRDLEEYFRHIFDSIPTIYRAETAQVLMTALGARQPLLAITYSFWDEIADDPGWALRVSHAPFSDKEIEKRIELTRRRLDGRCKGLLEVVAYEKSPVAFRRFRIDFMHRTVRDFLDEDSEVQKMMTSQGLPGPGRIFDLDACRCLLATMKIAPKAPVGQRGPRSFPGSHVRNILHFAHRVEPFVDRFGVRQDLVEILESAEKTFVLMTDTINGPPVPDEPAYFLGATCVHQVPTYLEYRLTHTTSPYLQSVSAGRPMLEYALSPDEHAPCPSPHIVELLLRHGAEPNLMYNGATVWQHFLSRLHWGALPNSSDDVRQVTSLLIQYGANVGHRFPVKEFSIVGRRGYERQADNSSAYLELKTAREIIEHRLLDGSSLISEALETSVSLSNKSYRRDESDMANKIVDEAKVLRSKHETGRDTGGTADERPMGSRLQVLESTRLRTGRTRKSEPIWGHDMLIEMSDEDVQDEMDPVNQSLELCVTKEPAAAKTTFARNETVTGRRGLTGAATEVSRQDTRRLSWLSRLVRSRRAKENYLATI